MNEFEFINEVNKKYSHSISIVGTYKDKMTKVECKCNICNHRWKDYPNHILKGIECPKCCNKGEEQKSSDKGAFVADVIGEVIEFIIEAIIDG